MSMELLRQCAEEGMRLGVTWKKRASNTIAGVDQMGGFSVCTVAERLADGRMAIIHVEAIYALDPWARLDDILPDGGQTGHETAQAQRLAAAMPGLSPALIDMMTFVPPGTCGRCDSFEPQGQGGRCRERGFQTTARELACPLFVAKHG
jgi:hypothetical protein